MKKAKKNKGQKRRQWWSQVKDYHAQQNWQATQATPAADGQYGTMATPLDFSNAPWNQPPVQPPIEVKDDDAHAASQ